MFRTMKVKGSSRTMLLACLLVLGFQFLFPIALRADQAAMVLDECPIPLEAPEEEISPGDGDSAIELTSAHARHLCGWFDHACGSAFIHADPDRVGLSLLPVAGLHPSAP